MGLLNKLVYDGVDSSDFLIYLSGEGVFNAPTRKGEEVVIPGRNGTLWIDEGCFNPITVKYPAFVGTKDEDEFREVLGQFRAELSSRGSYCKLTDTYHPDEFRLALFKDGLETQPRLYNRAGEISLTFECKPQRFLLSGETVHEFTDIGNITNPTLFTASPLIRVTGNGKVLIGEYMFIVSDNPGTIWIDTELMTVYIPAAGEDQHLTDEHGIVIYDELGTVIDISLGSTTPELMNSHVQFVNSLMPKIVPGTVNVGMTSGITKLEIIPRWWTV